MDKGIHDREKEIHVKDREIHVKDKKIHDREKEIRDREKKILLLSIAIDSSEKKLRDIETKLGDIQESYSWRMTAPFRETVNFFHRLARRGKRPL